MIKGVWNIYSPTVNFSPMLDPRLMAVQVWIYLSSSPAVWIITSKAIILEPVLCGISVSNIN